MSKILCFVVLFLIHLDTSISVDVKCEYKIFNYHVVGATYSCQVENILSITSIKNRTINSVKGKHEPRLTNSNVQGFFANDKIIEYFPSGLDEIYENLKLIVIRKGRLLEIHQSDLRPFPELVNLDLSNNDIKSIPDNLFDYNSKLKVLWLASNKVRRIYPSAFDGITELTYISFKDNVCIESTAKNDSAAVKSIIDESIYMCPIPLPVPMALKLAPPPPPQFLINHDVPSTENVEVAKLNLKILELEGTVKKNEELTKNLENEFRRNLTDFQKEIRAEISKLDTRFDELQL